MDRYDLPDPGDRAIDPAFHELLQQSWADRGLTDYSVAKACGWSSGKVRALRVGPRTFLNPADMVTLASATGIPIGWMVEAAGMPVGFAQEVSRFRRRIRRAS